jgi:hypothetical protein
MREGCKNQTFHWAGTSKPVRVCTIEDKGVYPTGLILIMTGVEKYIHKC